MENNNTEWKVKDKASHPTYGLVEVFEIEPELGFANVFPVDEEKWGTAARMVNISELKKL